VFSSGKTLHSSGINTDGTKRRAIVASYLLGRLRTQDNHFLHTTVEQAKQWPKKVRQLLSYDLHAHCDQQI
jgi:ectoine hydroxylase-related dioxygenase (phytanoyl-CoA dioxygenase family)